jgi:hypothetical protein
MNISKVAWSERRENRVIHLYVFEPDQSGKPRVMTMPFALASTDEVKHLLNLQQQGKEFYDGGVLHVCFDVSSGRLYLPDMQDPKDVQADPKLSMMFQAAQITVERAFGSLPMAPVIRGDPFETIRIRKLGDFTSVANFISKQMDTANMGDIQGHIDLPVVEANLSIMPRTVQRLPKGFDAKKSQGAYIGLGQPIEFIVSTYVSRDKSVDTSVHHQKPPFILINTSPEVKTSDVDKERIVTMYYKEYVAENLPQHQRNRFLNAETRTLKYLMYIGWSFRELCMWVLRADNVSDFRDLIMKGVHIFNAAKAIKADGYPDPSSNPYYYAFKATDRFPFKFQPQTVGEPYPDEGQQEIFHVVHFDPKSSMIVVRTPLYMSDDLIRKVLLGENPIYAGQYDLTEKIVKMNSDPQLLLRDSSSSYNVIEQDVANKRGRPSGSQKISFRPTFFTEIFFERKHISDYPQAADIVRDLCERLSTPEKKIRFDDLEVVVGPWTRVMGALGGYISLRRMQENNIPSPIEPVRDFKVYPPVILIDDAEYPSVGDRISVILHEYRHHINMQLWVASPTYDAPSNMSTPEGIGKWKAYLASPDEREAFITEFKYMLGIGMTKEQVLRLAMNKKPNLMQLPVARKFMELIDEAYNQVGKEQRDKETLRKIDESVRKMQDSGDLQKDIIEEDDVKPLFA